MNPPKAVAVIGYKNTGKTQIVEALVRELTARGYRLGTIKHTMEDAPLDTPGKDTWRHMKAGAVSTAILSENSTAFFYQESFKVSDALKHLGEIDFLIFEGFKTLKTVSRIIVIDKPSDVDLINGLELALVPKRLKIETTKDIPLIPIEQIEKLSDLVEKKAFPVLQGYNCGKCGFESCFALAKAIINDETTVSKCFYSIDKEVNLRVNGEKIPLNKYVQEVFKAVLIGLTGTLKTESPPKKIDISIEVDKNK